MKLPPMSLEHAKKRVRMKKPLKPSIDLTAAYMAGFEKGKNSVKGVSDERN